MSYFEGYYYKHQKGGDTVAFIVGFSETNAFIQVITNDVSHKFFYPLSAYRGGKVIRIGNCTFSQSGIELNIDQDNIRITGRICYANLTPLNYDIMGIFKYFPMECYHSIVSLHHTLSGSLYINGHVIDFTGGTGYIEGDRGTSFPKTYTWIQCNSFEAKCSVVASVASIPFMGLRFNGCICVVYHQNKEYRLATYLGVKILHCGCHGLVLRQGKYRMEIAVASQAGHSLLAPDNGKMARTIIERAACNARFRFYRDKTLLFDLKSDGGASFEMEM